MLKISHIYIRLRGVGGRVSSPGKKPTGPFLPLGDDTDCYTNTEYNDKFIVMII